MSASLVGSEMCIRDRPKIASCRITGCRQLQAVLGAFRRLQPVAESAVSYTHLTLPTICSV
eukprot:11884714-Alexandrium_andersonii.AAC.1